MQFAAYGPYQIGKVEGSWAIREGDRQWPLSQMDGSWQAGDSVSWAEESKAIESGAEMMEVMPGGSVQSEDTERSFGGCTIYGAAKTESGAWCLLGGTRTSSLNLRAGHVGRSV